MKRALIVGGANGIGLAVATELAACPGCEHVYIVDKADPEPQYVTKKMETFRFDLTADDFSFFDRFTNIDTLVITAGFGRLALFRDVEERHIAESFSVNTIAAMRLIRRFYDRIEGRSDFHVGVMVSIAGFMTSPFFSVYAATKAALRVFIESVNAELEQAGTTNRILNVSPGSIAGTSFTRQRTELEKVRPLAREIIGRLERKEDLFIPGYEETFREVLERYHKDFRAEGRRSYQYKLNSGRIKTERT